MAGPARSESISPPESFGPSTTGGLLALGGIGTLGLLLRLVGAAELPWASGEPGTLPLAARALALATGAATVPIAFALAWRHGAAAACALALLIATSPWHVHASRVAGPTTCAFLALLVVCIAFGEERPQRSRMKDRVRLALLAAAIVLFATMPADARRTGIPGLAPLLAGDVGVAVPLLALLQFARPRQWVGLLDAALFACVGNLLSARFGLGISFVTWVLPPLLVAAAATLCRFIEAAGSWRARLAFALLAIAPTLPSLASEHLDGGRFDLASLAPAFERARSGGEALYASDPVLAARAFHVESQPLDALPDAASERASFILLLLERGRVVGGESLPADVESGLELVGRSGRKRIDLGRFEARLYRRSAERR